MKTNTLTLAGTRNATPASFSTPSRKGRALLWTVQGALALLFLFAGGMKLVMSGAALAQQSPLPVAFIKFIGLAEAAGGLGLVLPGLLRIRRGLTPLAAWGLVIIMMGATVLSGVGGGVRAAVIPAVVGFLAGFVAYKRRSWLRSGSVHATASVAAQAL